MKLRFRKTPLLATVAFFLIAPALPGRAPDRQAPSPGVERIEKAIEALQELIELPENKEGLPASLLQKCRGIAIFPGVIKAAYGIGGQYGRGIVLIKNDQGEWSDPAFVSLIGGSIGWQIGSRRATSFLSLKRPRALKTSPGGKSPWERT